MYILNIFKKNKIKNQYQNTVCSEYFQKTQFSFKKIPSSVAISFDNRSALTSISNKPYTYTITPGIFLSILNLPTKTFTKTISFLNSSFKVTLYINSGLNLLFLKNLNIRFYLLEIPSNVQNIYISNYYNCSIRKNRRVKKWVKKDYSKQESYIL